MRIVVLRSRAIAALALPASLAGLTPSALHAQRTRDSAGVAIVHYALGDRPAFQWQVEPALEIGGDAQPGPTEFGSIVGVVRLSDASIAVADGLANEIRVFDADGRFLRILGRRGRGPGEFDGLRALKRAGDTLIGVDGQLRAQVFASDGALVRSLPRPRIDGFTIGTWLGWTPRGMGAYLAFERSGDIPEGRHTQRVALALIAPTPETQPLVLPEWYGGWVYYRRPGERARILGFGPSAHGAVTATRIWVGYSSGFTLTALDHEGHVRLRVTREIRREPVTHDDRAWLAGIESGQGADVPPFVRERLAAAARDMDFAEHHPAFSAIVPSTNDEVWVNRDRRGFQMSMSYHVSDNSSRWSVFDAQGRWLAEVTLPARFLPFDIGSDYVAGLSRDADHVDRVTVLRLLR